jgi:hypothetical protein
MAGKKVEKKAGRDKKSGGPKIAGSTPTVIRKPQQGLRYPDVVSPPPETLNEDPWRNFKKKFPKIKIEPLEGMLEGEKQKLDDSQPKLYRMEWGKRHQLHLKVLAPKKVKAKAAASAPLQTAIVGQVFVIEDANGTLINSSDRGRPDPRESNCRLSLMSRSKTHLMFKVLSV